MILITELMAMDGETDRFPCPEYLNARYVQVAHMYCKIRSNICTTFELAGLSFFIYVRSQWHEINTRNWIPMNDRRKYNTPLMYLAIR